ncbi:MAG: hypothetical protein LT071_09425 [Nocardioides sp.]|nr:hypothetical protein [Nocardioides sp.]
MDTTGWIILAVIVIALILVLAFAVSSMKRKSRADDHARAEQLREEARARTGDLGQDHEAARRAEAEAEEARRAAEEAARRAEEARTGVAQQEALQEDRLRAADRLDPEVDHRAPDYEPMTDDTTPPAEPGATDAGSRDTRGGDSRTTT